MRSIRWMSRSSLRRNSCVSSGFRGCREGRIEPDATAAEMQHGDRSRSPTALSRASTTSSPRSRRRRRRSARGSSGLRCSAQGTLSVFTPRLAHSTGRGAYSSRIRSRPIPRCRHRRAGARSYPGALKPHSPHRGTLHLGRTITTSPSSVHAGSSTTTRVTPRIRRSKVVAPCWLCAFSYTHSRSKGPVRFSALQDVPVLPPIRASSSCLSRPVNARQRRSRHAGLPRRPEETSAGVI